MKNLVLTVVCFLTFNEMNARPILEKTVDACRRNILGQIRCNKVKQQLVDYPCPTETNPDKTCEGWTLDCSGAGFSACSVQSNSGSGLALTDGIDNTWGLTLHDYAINQIETNNTLSGSHSETVVLPDNSVRVYTVVWTMSQNSFGDITGTVTVTCNV